MKSFIQQLFLAVLALFALEASGAGLFGGRQRNPSGDGQMSLKQRSGPQGEGPGGPGGSLGGIRGGRGQDQMGGGRVGGGLRSGAGSRGSDARSSNIRDSSALRYKSNFTTEEATTILEKMKTEMKEGFKLTKNANTSPSKIVFVAGVAGSGHEIMHEMFAVCVNTTLCTPEPRLSNIMMNGLLSAQHEKTAIEHIRRTYPLVQNVAKEKEDNLFVLGLGFPHALGMLAYPSIDGTRTKGMSHPDLFAMAYFAEHVGVDFRVIVLQSTAQEIISSLSAMGANSVSSKLLMDSASTLYSQLSLLDRRFYMCFNANSLATASASEKQSLKQFIHPSKLDPVFDKMVAKGMAAKSAAASDSAAGAAVSLDSNAYNAFHLSSRIQQISDLCKQSA